MHRLVDLHAGAERRPVVGRPHPVVDKVAPGVKPIGSTKSVLLTSRSSAAAATVSVAVLLLLPPSPPDGSSGVVVEIDAVLSNTRAALPGW